MTAGTASIADGIKLYYEDYGKGEVVIFIPGLTCTTEFFENNLEVIAEKHRVISYDPRSQGRSTITEVGNNFIQRGRDLAAFMDCLDLDQVIIAGWSLGAYDAYACFQEFGLDRIRAFINIDMPPKAIQTREDDWSEGSLEVVRSMYHSVVATDQPHFFEGYARYMIIREATDEEVNWIVGQSKKTPPGIAGQIVADANLCDYCDVVRDVARKIPVMHFIKEDWAATAVNWLDTNTPNVRKEVMGGHMMFWEEADKFNARFLEFVDSI